MMNKEDYVSLEVAKLLKEKGYNEECGYYYNLEEECYYFAPFINGLRTITYRQLPDVLLIPTLYEAQKWLRTKKGLHIEISYMNGDYWLYEILTIPNHDLIGLSDRGTTRYMSYEYALMAGIIEALKLI